MVGENGKNPRENPWQFPSYGRLEKMQIEAFALGYRRERLKKTKKRLSLWGQGMRKHLHINNYFVWGYFWVCKSKFNFSIISRLRDSRKRKQSVLKSLSNYMEQTKEHHWSLAAWLNRSALGFVKMTKIGGIHISDLNLHFHFLLLLHWDNSVSLTPQI